MRTSAAPHDLDAATGRDAVQLCYAHLGQLPTRASSTYTLQPAWFRRWATSSLSAESAHRWSTRPVSKRVRSFHSNPSPTSRRSLNCPGPLSSGASSQPARAGDVPHAIARRLPRDDAVARLRAGVDPCRRSERSHAAAGGAPREPAPAARPAQFEVPGAALNASRRPGIVVDAASTGRRRGQLYRLPIAPLFNHKPSAFHDHIFPLN